VQLSLVGSRLFHVPKIPYVTPRGVFKAVAWLTCIREALGSNLNRDN
jgi:hypothetical protein